MDGLQRVTFRFGAETEVRYLPLVPAPGDIVTHVDDLWVVDFVSSDGGGTTVICRLPRGDGKTFRDVA